MRRIACVALVLVAGCATAWRERPPESWIVELIDVRPLRAGDREGVFDFGTAWHYSADAREALVRWGPAAVPALSEALLDDSLTGEQKAAVLLTLMDMGTAAQPAIPAIEHVKARAPERSMCRMLAAGAVWNAQGRPSSGFDAR